MEELEAVNNPEDPAAGTRKVPFSRVLYIEQDDFRENPAEEYFRLSPGKEVRLRYGYFVTCASVVKDARRRTSSRSTAPTIRRRAAATAPDGRKVKSTIHWVSAAHAIDAEIRALRQALHQGQSERACRKGRTSPPISIPNSLEICRRRQAGAFAGRRKAREPLPVRARGVLLRRSRFHAGQAGLQPDARAER